VGLAISRKLRILAIPRRRSWHDDAGRSGDGSVEPHFVSESIPLPGAMFLKNKLVFALGYKRFRMEKVQCIP
jgi:hypothetical protein